MTSVAPTVCPTCGRDHPLDYIGASQAAKVLGLSRWGGKLDVYRELVGEAEPTESSIPMRFGLALERPIAELYEDETGVPLRKSHMLERMDEHPFLACHPDFTGPDGLIVEVKTAGSFRGWGDAPDGEVPVDYWCQVQHQMMVMGRPFADIAVVIQSRTFRIYRIMRDDLFIEGLQKALEELWWAHIIPREPPEVDGSEATRAWLGSTVYPDESGLIKPATAEQQLMASALRAATVQRKRAEAQEEELKNKVRDIIGEDSGLRGEDFTFTWKRNRPGQPMVDWKLVAKAYREFISGLVHGDEDSVDPEELEAIESLHTAEPKPGARVLRLTFREDDEA